eukprot:5028973-Pyramimonas_sp.AAC.1
MAGPLIRPSECPGDLGVGRTAAVASRRIDIAEPQGGAELLAPASSAIAREPDWALRRRRDN